MGKRHNHALSLTEAESIRREYAQANGDITYLDLALRFRVSESTIARICKGRTYVAPGARRTLPGQRTNPDDTPSFAQVQAEADARREAGVVVAEPQWIRDMKRRMVERAAPQSTPFIDSDNQLGEPGEID